MTSILSVPRIAPSALEFQGDLDRLIAEAPPRLLRLWPALAAALLAALVLVAALMPVDIVVSASGKLAADAPPMVLKPMARAVLREMLVRPGDVVRAGQVLARLDPTLPNADRAALQAERRSLLAEIARITSEISGQGLPAFGPAQGSETLMQAQVQAAHGALAEAKRRAVAAQIAALQAEYSQRLADAPRLAEQVLIARDVEDMRAQLASHQAGARSDTLAARAARLAAEGNLADHRARLAELQRLIGAARNDLAVFEASLKGQAAEALPPLQLRLAQIDDALDKANRLAELSVLSAPRDGVVLSVAPGGVGAVMAEGEAMIALIPSDAGLVAEISIASSEAGRVALGDAVALKIDAYPWRRMGQASGVLQSVSPATMTPEGQTAAAHPARVSLNTLPDALPAGAALIPGMTLTAEVHTGTRTVLEFFLDPLLRGVSESLREP